MNGILRKACARGHLEWILGLVTPPPNSNSDSKPSELDKGGTTGDPLSWDPDQLQMCPLSFKSHPFGNGLFLAAIMIKESIMGGRVVTISMFGCWAEHSGAMCN